ncbi:MAG: UDP-N-acetylmuramoyl-L-alanyl-D-glutamate--2,6-diaminopimelate ligase [Deltaproteobacteria bacterium]|nr:UDP-N-acetylmuramoyl-L-alanyl-D-glutamate--2,6-diaminopimelate ligase [Deltaproteobacteria bacterium]
MKLSKLAKILDLKPLGGSDPEITGIREDSREILPMEMFAAVKGANLDGRNFIDSALKNGAAAVLLSPPDMPEIGPRLLVDDSRFQNVMGSAAREIYMRPDEKLSLIGLTGTNGKSTVSYLLEAILKTYGQQTGVIGTVDFRWPSGRSEAPNTTPLGPLLYRTLLSMVNGGCERVVLEVSSHALALGRVNDLRFDGALFTNLSRDHLDFHGTMEEYYQAKKKLFTENLKVSGCMVVGIDDQYGSRLFSELGSKAVSFGLSEKANYRGVEIDLAFCGLAFTALTPEGPIRLRSPLLGRFNVLNVLAALAMARELGIDKEIIIEALEIAQGAPGRLQRVGDEYLVLVDYAHTPGALAGALESVRALEPEHLIVIFGCGGDRDRGKRPLMGSEAGRLSDLAILTSDNPRTEDPMAIINETAVGLTSLGLEPINSSEFEGLKAGELSEGKKISSWLKGRFIIEPDRRKAIKLAVKLMNRGDLVLVAGKGHEDYQIIGRKKIKFDDVEEVTAALKEIGRL